MIPHCYAKIIHAIDAGNADFLVEVQQLDEHGTWATMSRSVLKEGDLTEPVIWDRQRVVITLTPQLP